MHYYILPEIVHLPGLLQEILKLIRMYFNVQGV